MSTLAGIVQDLYAKIEKRIAESKRRVDARASKAAKRVSEATARGLEQQLQAFVVAKLQDLPIGPANVPPAATTQAPDVKMGHVDVVNTPSTPPASGAPDATKLSHAAVSVGAIRYSVQPLRLQQAHVPMASREVRPVPDADPGAAAAESPKTVMDTVLPQLK